MIAYIIRRVLLMVPTVFGIMLVAFLVVQFAPGGPIESVIAKLSGADVSAAGRATGSSGGDFGSRANQAGSQLDAASSKYRGPKGSIRSSSRSLKSSSVSTSRRTSASF